MSDLEAILNGDPAEEVTETEAQEEASEVTEQEEPKVEEPKAEEQEEPKDGEKPDESTTDSKKADNTHWQFEAYKDEKRKRQELEREIAALKAPAKEPEKAPDVFENQDAYTNYIQDQIQSNNLAMRAEMSQFHANREFGKDVVDQKLSTFREMIAKDPSLSQRVQSSSSPVYEAIDIVDKAERLAQLDNVDDWEAKKTAELEEKIRAEMEAKYAAQAEKRSSVTPSLNSKASSSNNRVEPQTLSDLLGGR